MSISKRSFFKIIIIIFLFCFVLAKLTYFLYYSSHRNILIFKSTHFSSFEYYIYFVSSDSEKTGEERIPSRASNTSPDLSAIFERTENISRSRHKERDTLEDELDFDLSQLLEPEKHHCSKEKYETAEKNPLGLDLSELLEHINVGPIIDTSRSYRDSAFTTPRYLEKTSQPIRGSDFQPIRGSDSRTSGFTMNSWDSRRKMTRTSQRNPPTPSQRSGHGYGRPGTQPGTAQGAVAGSDAVGRASQASSVPTFTNVAVSTKSTCV